jgi:hypothetical protein
MFEASNAAWLSTSKSALKSLRSLTILSWTVL